MRPRARFGIVTGLVVALLTGTASLGRSQEPLQPYQMVRSLQLVQDRLAAGDHAALAMQAKLLELIDARFRVSLPGDFSEPRNLHALLVYGMSGGNPATVEATTARIQLNDTNRAVVDGVSAYLSGNPAKAIAALRDVEPEDLTDDLVAYVALVKGSLLVAEEPDRALVLFDRARLSSPGTLIEEAALRRSIAVAAVTGDTARFALASTQYVARFLYSPYASQFADTFVSGVVALNLAISPDKLADITSMMDGEREKVIYLRIARRAAIDGLAELSAFASAMAEKPHGDRTVAEDPRALLYASLSTLTSHDMDEVRERLGKIDPSLLSANDRSLLDAAKAITREVIAPPPAPVLSQITPAEEDGLPLVEGVVSERPAADIVEDAAAPVTPSEMAGPASEVAQAIASDPTDVVIEATRRKLDKIDLMLEGSPQ